MAVERNRVVSRTFAIVPETNYEETNYEKPVCSCSRAKPIEDFGFGCFDWRRGLGDEKTGSPVATYLSRYFWNCLRKERVSSKTANEMANPIYRIYSVCHGIWCSSQISSAFVLRRSSRISAKLFRFTQNCICFFAPSRCGFRPEKNQAAVLKFMGQYFDTSCVTCVGP